MNKKHTYKELEHKIKELEIRNAELKLEKDQIRKNETAYRNLFETMSQGIVYQDVEGRIISANRSAERILGLSFDQMTGKAVIDPQYIAIYEDGSDFFRGSHPAKLALKTGKAVKNKIMGVFNPEKNSSRWISVDAVPVFKNDESEPYQVYTTYNDITNLKIAKEALFDSEEKFRRVVEFSPMGTHLYSIEPDGRLVLIGTNPAADAILGMDTKQHIGETIENVFPLLANTEILDQCRRACSDGTSWHTELIDEENGKIRKAFEIHAFQTANGIMALLFLDITKRKRSEEELRQREKMFKKLFNFAPYPYFLSDTGGTLLDYNQKAEKLIGYQKKEIIGRNVFGMNILSGNYISKAKNLIEGSRKGFTSEPAEFELTAKNGEKLWAEISVIPLEVNQSVTMLGVARDITDHIKMEKEKEWLQSQLQQAQKMEAIGTLAGGIAHDFNNILFPIVGFAEMLQEDLPADSDCQAKIQQILVGTKRARDLVKQILAFSRQTNQEIKPLRIQAIVNEVLKLCRSSLPATIEIRQDIDTDCDCVLADPTQIHQIVMNIITNAYHAMLDSGGLLTIKLQNIDIHGQAHENRSIPKGKYVRFTAEDTGIGMDKGVIAKIFEPYFTTKEKNKGTGLGLSVVHGIVKSYGGEIVVKSRPGEGSRFDIYFPAYASKHHPVEILKPDEKKMGNERILLIDDDPRIVKLEKQALERLGYRVETNTNPLEALAVFNARPHQFDLVISDMTMPVMTGDKMAMEMMNIRPDIPVIICTGYSEKISKKEAMALGIKGFLMKPVLLSKLANMVRTILDNN